MIKVGDKVRVKYLDVHDENIGVHVNFEGEVELVDNRDNPMTFHVGDYLFYEDQLEVITSSNEESFTITGEMSEELAEFIASTEDTDLDTNNPDLINHPPHYTSAGMETIDKMEFFFGTKALKIYCTINAYKYDSRAGLKDDVQKDGEKSTWYINKANELQEKIDNGEGILGSLDYLLE